MVDIGATSNIAYKFEAETMMCQWLQELTIQQVRSEMFKVAPMIDDWAFSWVICGISYGLQCVPEGESLQVQ